MPTLDAINKDIRLEQILHFFGIIPDSNNKILCPVHREEVPSFQVNQDFGFCFGCKRSFNNFFMAKTLLERRDNREYSNREVYEFFETEKLPEPSTDRYEEHKYRGPVPIEFIDYWQSCMTDYSYVVLEEKRLLTRKTAEKYKIGWRPDYGGFSIPFWRGEPGNSLVDVVQFRLPTDKPKYVGLKNHNRGTFMNVHLLDVEQPYVVILFGAFDAILALQDNVIAVGTNGSAPFKSEEKKRVQKLFEKQSNVVVLPDNTVAEYEPAYKLAEWLGGQVRFFPKDLPDGCDYIDYRRQGYCKEEFMRDILQLTTAPEDIVENIKELIKVGDPYNLAWVHAVNGSKKSSPQAVAQAVVYSGPLVYSEQQWQQICKPLQQVTTEDDLYYRMQEVSKISYGFNGGW